MVAIGPETRPAMAEYWAAQGIPFPGIPDPEHRIAERFGQEVRRSRFGRLPALLVVDAGGTVRAAWYGRSMRDLPDPQRILAVLEDLP